MTRNCTTRRVHRRASSAALAGGAVVCAAMTGIVAVHADRPPQADPPLAPIHLLSTAASLLPGAADLLDGAIKNFTEADQAFSQMDLSDFPDFDTFIHGQLSTQSSDLSFLGLLQSAENYLSSGGPSLTGDLLYVYSYIVNLQWNLYSDVVLALDHVVESAFASNSPGIAALGDFGLFLTDLGMFGEAFGSLPINLAALGPVTPASGAEATTSATAADATDPTASPEEATSSSAASAEAVTSGSAATAAAAASAPACDCPALPSQLNDPFLQFVYAIDPNSMIRSGAIGFYAYENNDVIGTIAMQMNQGLASDQLMNSLGLDLIFTQLNAGDWKSSTDVTTNFFEDFVKHLMNPDAFTSAGLPADPGNVVETIAYQLDELLKNTVYATDLNLADVFLWP